MEDNLDYSKDLILRMNRNIYPAFTDNVKRECVISPDIADRQKVTLNNILEGSNSEQFNIICSNSNIISNNFIVGYESLKFTLQKVQYSWNASANWGFGGGYSLSNFLAYTSPLTAQSSIVGLNANSVAFYDDSLIQSPLQFVGLCCDPVNSICAETSIGVANQTFKTPLSQPLVDAYNRLKSKEYLRRTYPSTLPDEIADYTDKQELSRFNMGQ